MCFAVGKFVVARKSRRQDAGAAVYRASLYPLALSVSHMRSLQYRCALCAQLCTAVIR